jgi:hypothetical protein
MLSMRAVTRGCVALARHSVLQKSEVFCLVLRSVVDRSTRSYHSTVKVCLFRRDDDLLIAENRRLVTPRLHESDRPKTF